MISLISRLWKSHPVSDSELSALTDGRLDAPRAAEIDSHARACEACRATLAELRSLKAMLAALPQVRPQRSFAVTEESPASAAAGPAPARWPGRLALMPAMALAALVLLLAVDLAQFGGSDSSGNFAATTSQKSAESGAGGLTAPAASGAAAGRDNAALAPPAPAGTPGVAAAASAAERQAPPNAAADSAGAAPTQPAPSAPSATGETHPFGSEDANGGTNAIRVLEAAAAALLVASAAYVFFRSRHAA